MSAPDCLVFERRGDWAAAIRRNGLYPAGIGSDSRMHRSKIVADGAADRPASGGTVAAVAARFDGARMAAGRIVEIREWDGLRSALEISPSSIVCVDVLTVSVTLWLARWPLMASDFPTARVVALASREDRAEEAIWRDAGVIEVIRGRDDIGCLGALHARQLTRYPAPAASWRAKMLERLPWPEANTD